MFENFMSSMNAVLSVFMIIAAGYISRRWLKLDGQTTKKLNKIVFYCLMPVMLFGNVYRADFKGIMSPKFICIVVVGIGLTYAFFRYIMRFSKNKPERQSVMIQAAFRGNYLILGAPLMAQLFPEDDQVLVAALVLVVTPMYNILATVLFERYRAGKPDVKKMILSIIENPMNLGMFIGVIVMLLKLPLPTFFESAVNSIGGTASTIALFVLGMQFEFGSLKTQKKEMLFVILTRLIIGPAVWLSVAALIGLRGMEFGVLIPVFGSPVAVASYTMAAEMGGDAELAANCVAVTTAISVITLFGWIFLFKTLGVL